MTARVVLTLLVALLGAMSAARTAVGVADVDAHTSRPLVLDSVNVLTGQPGMLLPAAPIVLPPSGLHSDMRGDRADVGAVDEVAGRLVRVNGQGESSMLPGRRVGQPVPGKASTTGAALNTVPTSALANITALGVGAALH